MKKDRDLLMVQINECFRKRIGFPLDAPLTFSILETVLEKMATTIPFENISILHGENENLTLESIMEKVLVRKEGGLCYEINTLLYHFLRENQFEVELIRATIYDQANNDWSRTGMTHVIVLLTYQKNQYILDAGFALNAPMIPVPLSGEVVHSKNGEFQVFSLEDADTFLLKMKRKYKDHDWNIGYKFFRKLPIQAMSELEEIKDIIVTSPYSPFNKSVLIAKLTSSGSVLLTNDILRVISNGDVMNQPVDEEQRKQVRMDYFGF